MTGLGTVIILPISFIAFVWFYAQFMNPGHEQAFYRGFANLTGAPFMFCFAPFTMYIISRWLCDRVGGAFYLHGLLYFISYHVIDFVLIAFTGDMPQFLTVSYLLIVISKLIGVLLGAYFSSKANRQHSSLI
ncbi:hypothetical protein OAP18_02375 [Gammaproteobacteria bacterium]|nr:hypothetical protein [Gammaproteobacteria bacterium]